jgi:energy-coupling factor transporter ATP-binding protein EcfA2
MKLDRMVLVNWGQLRPGDYEIANLTLLTGPTGAGKTTLLDGLQTLMTAAYPGIVLYNPGQEEVQYGKRKGKTKRTLESFVVGAEYSSFSRPHGAQGYLGAVFRPTGDETAKPFTALVAASARVDGMGERRDPKLEKLELIIVDDAALTVEDFAVDAEHTEWIAVEDIVKRLKAKYPKVTTYDGHKRDYLCALYGRFRGRNSTTWDEAQNAARAWSHSIASRPIGSVDELVRSDILEFDAKLLHESITRISELMRQVTNLKEEGKRIETTVKRLGELKHAIGQTSLAFEDQVQHDLLLAKMHIKLDDDRIALEEEKKQTDNRLAATHEERAKSEKLLRDAVDRNRIAIAARLQGIPAHEAKKQHEDTVKRATSTAHGVLNNLSVALLSAAKLDNAARQLVSKPVDDSFPRLRASVQAVADAIEGTAFDRLAGLRNAVVDASRDAEPVSAKLLQLAEAFDDVDTGIGAVHSALVGPDDSVSTAIAAESSLLESRVKTARTDVNDLASRKESLTSGAGNYDRDTKAALTRIREALPEANVEVLCDLVEPASDEWQPAIEGYLGNARFGLIVRPEWESKTIDFLQTWGSRSKVIQGKRCLEAANASRVPQDSIIYELKTEHPIARAYLIEQYGPVVKVQTSSQLRDTARGLTKDGKGSGSRTMFIVDQGSLVFGAAARKRALEEVTEKLAIAEKDVARLEGLQGTLLTVRQLLRDIKEPTFDARPLALAASEMEHSRQALSQLDLTEVSELEERLKQLEAQLKEHDTAITAAEKAVTLAEQRIIQAEGEITKARSRRYQRLEELEHQIHRLNHLCEANAEKTYTVLAQQVTDLLESGTMDVHAIQSRLATLRAAPDKLLGDVRELLSEYNASARQEERFVSAIPHLHDATSFDPYYGPVVVLGRSISKLHEELGGLGLYHNREEVKRAERSFHDVFTKQFCFEIKSKVDDGVRVLKQLNAELQNLKFGTDQYSIDWSKGEPEFEEYYAFFGAVTELADSAENTDLFAASELSPKQVEVRDRLVKLLLDPDQERAGKELLRIADYRNYRRYEIWNTSGNGRVALSTWQTGSGGQMETPAYIVRSAVVANRLRFFEKGASLRLLVNDEAFSRMDEARAHAVLKYFRDHLGLQVLCAMPTKHAGALRSVFDKEFSFSRVTVEENGELDFISDCDERVFHTDRMRELWDRQRAEARQQAKLAFEAAEPPAVETGQ